SPALRWSWSLGRQRRMRQTSRGASWPASVDPSPNRGEIRAWKCAYDAPVSRGRSRLSMPEFLAELGRPRQSLLVLLAGSLALLAVGLDPRVFSAGTVDAQ